MSLLKIFQFVVYFCFLHMCFEEQKVLILLQLKLAVSSYNL